MKKSFGINPGAVVKVGDRFDIQSPTRCGAGRISATLTRNRDRGQNPPPEGMADEQPRQAVEAPVTTHPFCKLTLL